MVDWKMKFIMVISALFLIGCTSSVQEIKRWEVQCFTDAGVAFVTDTLEGGRIYEHRGTITHKPIHAQWHNSNAIYTGNCRAKMLESHYIETVY